MTSLLCHPRTRRVRSTTCHVDPSAAYLDEKYDIQRLQPCGFDGEEIAGNDLIFIMREKCAPTAPSPTSFRSRRNTRAFKLIADRRASNVVPQFAELTHQLAVAPG